MTISSRTAWAIAVPGMAGLGALCFLSLFMIPAYKGTNLFIQSRPVCIAAAQYVIRSGYLKPAPTLAQFERDNPSYCRNALTTKDADGTWNGSLFDQIAKGAVYVRVTFGPKWRAATGMESRIVVVKRSGVDDPT